MEDDFEDRLINVAKPYLDFCRAGDWEHAERVVKWVKDLGEGRVDLNLLITAGYIHDIGWHKVLPSGKLDLDEMLQFEGRANANSPKYAREVMDKLSFSEPEIQTVLRLIDSADRHEANHDDEEIIVDADNLSKLCLDHLRQKYQKESYVKVTNLWGKEFVKRVRTEKGRKLYPSLLAKLKQEVKKLE